MPPLRPDPRYRPSRRTGSLGRALALLLTLWAGGCSFAEAQVQVAIIIDDLGYHKEAGERAIQLPGPVTLAVLPYLAHSSSLAAAAGDAGKEILLHAPMEPRDNVPWEAGGLSSDLSTADRQQALSAMLAAVPGVKGVNNHMGSQFTEDEPAMAWLATELQQRQLYFVDSMTSSASRGWRSARDRRLPYLKRDIFLDNEPDIAAIESQLHKLVSLAHRRGYAVAIGHPYLPTLEVLEAQIPLLELQGVELITASELAMQLANGQLADRRPGQLAREER